MLFNLKIARYRRSQHGIGMIEVLVALVISALALLGLAGLQVVALKSQKVSHFRSLATQYSADMADRIRANAEAVTNQTASYETTDQYPAIPPAPDCVTSGVCRTAQEVADRDKYEWRVALQEALTGGWGTISAYHLSSKQVTITVYFREPGKKNDDPGSACNAAVFPAGVDRLSIRCFQTLVTP